MVLVHGLLVILDSRRFLSVEFSRWVGPCTMGESRFTSWVEIISCQVGGDTGIGMVKAKTLRQLRWECDSPGTISTRCD